MKKTHRIKIFAGISALLISVSMMPTQSAAQGVQLDLGNGRVRIQGPDDGRNRRDDRDRYDRRDDRRDDRRSGCSPREALSAASRYLRDPRINSVNRRFYAIDGFGRSGGGRGRPDGVRISTDSGCSRVG